MGYISGRNFIFCCTLALLLGNVAKGSSVGVSVCNYASVRDPAGEPASPCLTNSTGELISIGASGAGTADSRDYSWSYTAAAQIEQNGNLVPGLGVAASISEYRSGYINFLLPVEGRRLFANAGVDDGLTIADVEAGTVSFTLKLEGEVDFALSDALTDLEFFSPQFGNRIVWQDSGRGTDYVPLVTSITLTAPFSNHRLDYSLSLQVGFYCSYFSGISCIGNNNSAVGSANANFLDTAKLGYVQVRDTMGNLIQNPVITSDAGYVYPTASPEPASFLLIGAGLPLLLGWRLRRRIGT